MTLTPWGEAETLRERKLAPGPGAPRSEVERNQRERVYGAMVASVTERGYEATSVEDVVRVSGVSRSSFYRYFADKHECFMATLRAILAGTLALVAENYEGGVPSEAGAREGMRTMFGLIAAQPAAARLCFAAIYAAGPEAVEAVSAAERGFRRITREAVEQIPEQAGMPAPLMVALVGSLRSLIQARLVEGREAELPGMAEELWSLGRIYPAPPGQLGRVRLAPAAVVEEPCFDAAEEIIAAACKAFAERGYTACTIAEIAAAARVSRSTLYAHFEGKEELFAAALDACQSRLWGVSMPAFRRARQWPWGVRAALEAHFAYFASHPTFARLIATEIHAAGPVAASYRERYREGLAELLASGYEEAAGVPAIATEAIGAAIDALIGERVLAGKTARLRELAPFGTYIALTPFIGPEQACEIAQARGPARRGDGGTRQ